MCSSIFLVAYAVGIVVGAGLTTVSLATPAWRKLQDSHYSNYYGIFKSCADSNLNSNQCLSDWENAPDWKKAALGCLAGAVALCALGFAWSLVACCMCCCTSCLTPPLPIFAGLACVLDVAGVAVYSIITIIAVAERAGLKSGQDLGDVPTNIQALESKGDFGYSMWVGIAAIVVLFVDMLIGAVLVKTAKILPI
uniref:Uncharacterized protein n=1 Tax=Romanomermis culicivorax TaxID=13658 RepID=A0A915J5B7_ROMCU